MLKNADKVSIVCSSDGFDIRIKKDLNKLDFVLKGIGLEPVWSKFIYSNENQFATTAKDRANVLMDSFKNKDIKAIFDISGGDVANEILPYLDFKEIGKSDAEFFGYSDLSTVINAIYTKTNKSSTLYQLRNLIYKDSENQIDNFKKSILNGENNLYDFKYEFIQGSCIGGEVIGGNVRCFLKLAGTEYFPDTKDKILFVESFGGSPARVATYFAQLEQIGVFSNIKGVILGDFTEINKNDLKPNVSKIILNYIDKKMPICVTDEIGHRANSKAIKIGSEIFLENRKRLL